MAVADRPGWRTSSYSGNGQTCVEVDPGPHWRTSSFSGNGNTCVEVLPGPAAVRVRDTKDHGLGPVLVLDPPAWAALLDAATTGAPVTTGPLTVALDPRRTVHDGEARDTSWHVTHDGTTLHLTDAERAAFAAGVHASEFAFALA